jgi:hypothetical protein
LLVFQDVDARHKAGHDGVRVIGRWYCHSLFAFFHPAPGQAMSRFRSAFSMPCRGSTAPAEE